MTDYFDNAPCCYFSFNDSGALLFVNQTLCTVLGYNREELTGKKVETIFSIPAKIFYQTHFFPLLKMHGHAEEIFIFLQAKNGSQLPLLMNAGQGENDGVPGYACVGIIVQNRKQFEDELVNAKNLAERALSENTGLKKAQEELKSQTEALDVQMQLVNNQNNKLKQFNKVATHDLQEPLRKIIFLANLLKDAPGGDLTQQENLTKLFKEASVMSDTLSGLQQYVWLYETPITPETVSCLEIIQKVKKQLAGELGEDKLEITTAKLPVIKADHRQFHLLFYELLYNAVLYKKAGEKAVVGISATVIKKNTFKAVEGRYEYQDVIKIVIKDEGIGFDPQYENMVFELFKKLHHSRRKGVGLALCKLVVENHNGLIEADSMPNNGTSISILLPGDMLVR
ncbi:MAG: ATP-binding protein [Ferruginibacter sp.]